MQAPDPREDELELVHSALVELSAKGSAHAIDGPRATNRWFNEVELLRRQFEVADWYFGLQADVTVDARVAIVTAGAPGAGKSTSLARIGLLDGSYRNIDSDIIKDRLLEECSADGVFDDLLSNELADGRPVTLRELSSLVHRESTAIADAVIFESLRRGENIIMQGTLAWDEQPRILTEQLKGRDYVSLRIIDVQVSLEEALRRAKRRWRAGRIDTSDPLGGRFVNPSSIEQLYRSDGSSVCSENALVLREISQDVFDVSLDVVDGAESSEQSSSREGADLKKQGHS